MKRFCHVKRIKFLGVVSQEALTDKVLLILILSRRANDRLSVMDPNSNISLGDLMSHSSNSSTGTQSDFIAMATLNIMYRIGKFLQFLLCLKLYLKSAIHTSPASKRLEEGNVFGIICSGHRGPCAKASWNISPLHPT